MRWVFFAAIGALAWTLRVTLGPAGGGAAASTLLALGLLMIGGDLAGRLAARARLPRITGYLILGMALGPFALGLVSAGDLASLHIFEEIALGLIALTAGGEFRVEAVAERWREIVGITGAHAVGILVVSAGIFWLALGRIPFLGPLGPGEILAAAALLSVIAVAKSPATTIAIITETRAEGRLVDTVLGVTILKDLVILLLFTLVSGLARGWTGGGGVDAAAMAHLGLEIGLSLGAGLLLGLALGAYLTWVRLHPEITVLAVVLISMELARSAGLEHLLVAMAAGFAARNIFPRAAGGFLHALERSSPPVYVIFFGLIGAGLDLGVFAAAWGAVVFLFLVRLALVWGLTGATAAALGAEPPIRRWAWMGFVAQAGFSLGLATRIARDFPAFGKTLAAVVVGSVVLNQLIGPVLWRHALVASGEAQQDGP